MKPLTHAITASVFVAGCVGTDSYEPDGPCDASGEERFLPVVEGATWTYERAVVDTGVLERRSQRVGPFETMTGPKEGVTASPQITTKASGTIINWQEDTGDAIVRHLQIDEAGEVHRDDLYEDYKGRLAESPERLIEGARYSHSYTATTTVEGDQVIVEQRTEDWHVVSDGELVDVPAGQFCAMQITRQRTTDGEAGPLKQYWFARGVGKVMERSDNQTEVLIDHDIP